MYSIYRSKVNLVDRKKLCHGDKYSNPIVAQSTLLLFFFSFARESFEV